MESHTRHSTRARDAAFRVASAIVVFAIVMGVLLWGFAAVMNRTIGEVLESSWIALSTALVVVVIAALKGDTDNTPENRRSDS